MLIGVFHQLERCSDARPDKGRGPRGRLCSRDELPRVGPDFNPPTAFDEGVHSILQAQGLYQSQSPSSEPDSD